MIPLSHYLNVGALLFAISVVGIFLIPVSFYVVESWRERREARNKDESAPKTGDPS